VAREQLNVLAVLRNPHVRAIKLGDRTFTAHVPRAPVAGSRRARSVSAAAPTERFGDVKEPGRFYLYNAKMKDKESNEQGILVLYLLHV
jgi:hypothetical protein